MMRMGVLTLFLAGCGSAGAGRAATAVPQPSPTPATDPQTGLPLNPDAILVDTDFVVTGEVININSVPQDAPLFKVRAANGRTFQILAQPLADIYLDDGSQLALHEYTTGLQIRATVHQGDAVGLLGEPVLSSNNLQILTQPTP